VTVRDARQLALGAGLNVQAVLSVERLAETLPQLAPLASDWPSLLLLASTGTSLWTALHAAAAEAREHPIDSFVSERLAEMRALIPEPTRLLWPDPNGGTPFPVSLAGRLAGWGHRSPMGLTIHPRHGLWMGYRGAVLLGLDLPEDVEPDAPSPCASCDARPCLTPCPVSAVGGPDGINVVSCFTERLRDGAACATSCAARLACPAGAPSRYSDEQIAHHQTFANRSFGRYVLDQHRPVPVAWREE
jgi:epoxyqueuosine reductase